MAETFAEQAGDSLRTAATTTTVETVVANGTAQTIASGVSGAATGVGIGTIGGAFGITVAAAASLVLSQVNYDVKLRRLREMYKDEVGAQLGKSPEKVTNKDIEIVAKGDSSKGIEANKTIADGLSKLKTRRNIGMAVTTLAILGTMAIMLSFGSPTLFAGGVAATIGNFAVKALAGFAVHSMLEKPLHWAAKKIFRQEETTQDIISELRLQHRRGKALSREQVVGVYVSANKELSDFVKGQFGKDFDELNVQQKRAITDSFEQYIPVTALTERLNSGSVKISELAFAAQGQSSGVAPNSVKDDLSMVGKVRHAMHSPHTPPMRKPVEYDNPIPARSFVERYEAEKSRPRTLH